MKKVCTALAICLMCASAYGDFVGAYAPANWTLLNEAAGSGTLTAAQMQVVGGDALLPGRVEYYITVPTTTTLKFHWDYICFNSSGWDWSYYAINDVATTISGAAFGVPDSGDLSVAVTAGQKFSLGVYTVDGGLGGGTLTVTKFVPEPASLSLLALGGLALLRRR